MEWVWEWVLGAWRLAESELPEAESELPEAEGGPEDGPVACRSDTHTHALSPFDLTRTHTHETF